MKSRSEKNCNGTGFILLSILTAAGIILGTLYSAKHGFSDRWWLHQYFIYVKECKSFFCLFTCTAVPSLIFLTAVFVSGVSAVGQPLSVILLLYRSFGAGLSAAAVYESNGIKAVAALTALVLPETVLLLIIAVIAVREAMRSSCGLAIYMIKGDCFDNRSCNFRLYSVRFAVLASITILISAGNAVLNIFFSGLLRI